jgi:2-polyprenyl-3-methyl-5-hydroxy-6-metoxy-1,4-benzoquinol methylase
MAAATPPNDARANRDYDQLWGHEWQLVQSVGPMTANRYRLILAQLQGVLTPEARVLDIGCGNGTLMARLLGAMPGLQLGGIEFSETAVAAAPASVRERIRVGSLFDTLPLLHERFDLIICSEVLEHIEDASAAMRLIAAALAPGGKLVLTVPCGKRWWSRLDEHVGHFRRYELHELRALVEAAGLAPRRVIGWGVLFGLLYDRATVLMGAKRVEHFGSNRAAASVSVLLQQLFRVDDLLPSRFGIQAVVVAQAPGAGGA